MASRPSPRPRRRKLLFSALLAVSVLLLGELGCRAFWSLKHGVHFLRPDLLDAFYPEPDYLAGYTVRNDDGAFDVLLLGGSVVNPRWGFVQEALYEELLYRTRREVRVYNMSEGGHTSRDSYLKYRHRSRHRFDAVVVYHGINETRANNCPPEVFRPDYTHFAWYAEIELLTSHAEAGFVVLPASLHRLWMAIGELFDTGRYLQRDAPRQDWLRFGAEVKSAASFAANLRAIVDIARSRGEPVLLVTFAHFVPADYEIGRFYRRELDYVRYGSPLELWGRPEHVVAGIEAHNAVVREVAAERGTLLVDLAREMPARGDCFNDPCHLSYRGSAVFAERVAVALAALPDRPR